MFKLKVAQAHCDIPCKIYDPHMAQLAAMSVIRILHLIQEISGANLTPAGISRISRLATEKEKEAQTVKSEVVIIWGDYFKEPQIKFFPKIHELVHSIMLSASKCKQELDVKNGLDLLNLLNQFSEIFWESKGFETELVKAPYPPSLGMTKPILDNV